ncbi:MAG: translocation/assembly module TamB domain-containing protein, partial [Bryobacteraceae bacterium]|nr:translocation/assembly module TamB domain-containing protein [Bryobacteraceae bacterium]
ASFSAKETQLSLSGTAGLKENAPLNLRLTGSANLALLSTFRPDIEASGRAGLDASIRGTPADPSLSGRMTISGASFFLKDLPNGIENANGTVYFEKNRANIEKLSGQTGGGQFLITGFLGINQGEFNYRLNAKGSGIRIRYPEGVSTTADASLDLVGTPARSLLSGTVTVLKSGFIGGGDFGEMVGGATNPIPPPATRNEFLRNLQFDVKIRTAPDATLISNYTEGLETEANLQLRGSPSKPVLLGDVEVNQGTIRFFGNRYTISRGELLFYNTAVVQPAIDLDLETRIRGVTVYINVSGPLARLNVNYRSEPPLQSNEILALLTVGRTPAVAGSSLQATSTIRNQNVLESASSNSLLGGALSAGISGRVERFFGASRIKIDPQATGVDNVAQARLSIEQSLSRDVTVTFVTNLSRTQEQIVRVEWDVSRQWQVIAVRDENGIFAVDFIYRTRFK